jgi:LysM repeat protein
MSRSKKVKTILLSTGLTLGLSVFITANVYAYTAGTASYTAVSGDSLFKISRVFHTTVENLMNANGLRTTSLNIGKVLKVPGDTYTVQKGDSLYLIAQKYKMPLSEISRANNIYNDRLDIGQRLAVPVPGSASIPANTQPNAEPSTTSVTPAPPVASAPVNTPAPPVASAPVVAPAADSAANAPVTKSAQAEVYSAEDLDVLSRLIMAETQGEPYQAKVAVGAVVMNRVQSGLFTDSVKGVIYQNINGYFQFTPVVNGWINKPANTDSINAAKDALNGADPTSGALWYYDDSTTNQFMLSKEVAIKIGVMVFAY